MLLTDAIIIVANLDYLIVKTTLEANGICTVSDRTLLMRRLLAQKVAAGEITSFRQNNLLIMAINTEKFFTKNPNADQQKRLDEIREAAQHLTQCIQDLTPASAEQTLAVRSVMSAVHHSSDAMLINE